MPQASSCGARALTTYTYVALACSRVQREREAEGGRATPLWLCAATTYAYAALSSPLTPSPSARVVCVRGGRGGQALISEDGIDLAQLVHQLTIQEDCNMYDSGRAFISEMGSRE